MTELHSQFIVTIMMAFVAPKKCERSRSIACLYPVYHSQSLVLVRGKLYTSRNVTCSEANTANPDMRVPSVLVAPSVPACQSMHPTTELTVCNVRCHDRDTTTSHCANTADSVHGGSYDSSVSEPFCCLQAETSPSCMKRASGCLRTQPD